DSQKASDKESVFDQLKTLERALITGDTDSIQDLLPRLDQSISQVIEIRTRIGSLTNSIQNADTALDQMNLNLAEYKSKIEDADVAELFSDLKRQQQILEATYKISANVSNKSLLDFIR
ncbi:MAG: flagellin, partial [Bacteriovoracaceae bacterium]